MSDSDSDSNTSEHASGLVSPVLHKRPASAAPRSSVPWHLSATSASHVLSPTVCACMQMPTFDMTAARSHGSSIHRHVFVRPKCATFGSYVFWISYPSTSSSPAMWHCSGVVELHCVVRSLGETSVVVALRLLGYQG